jgi:hypothetical protein
MFSFKKDESIQKENEEMSEIDKNFLTVIDHNSKFGRLTNSNTNTNKIKENDRKERYDSSVQLNHSYNDKRVKNIIQLKDSAVNANWSNQINLNFNSNLDGKIAKASMTRLSYSKLKKFDFELKINVVQSKSGQIVNEIKMIYSCNKNEKLISIDFINNCLANIKQPTDLDIIKIRLAVLNNLGIFVRIVKDDENIFELINDFRQKSVYLCLYVFDDTDSFILNTQSHIAVHLMNINTLSDTKAYNLNEGQIGKYLPVLINWDKTELNSEITFLNKVKTYLNNISVNTKKSKIDFKFLDKFRVLETSEIDLIQNCKKFTNVKHTDITEYFILKKNKLPEMSIIRLAIDVAQL